MIIRTLAALALSATMAAPALAQTILGGAQAMPAEVRLHSGWAEPDGRRIVGLRVDLEPGWKTYWRSPGAAGIPPHFDWSGSRNVADVNIVFPRPEVFQSFGMRTIGYSNQMILPIAVTVENPNRPLRLRLSLSYGLCEEICIPAQADLALDIMPGENADGAEVIQAALSEAPTPAAAAGMRTDACELMPTESAFEARIAFDDPPVAAPVVVAEGEGAYFGEMNASIEDGALVARGEMRMAEDWIDRSALRLTVLANDGTYISATCAPG
ncbi:MAG: protein-disulfide reductase DsbD domain-containing protein [Pseudomonadota bacterium]